jgi:hypothetical protein
MQGILPEQARIHTTVPKSKFFEHGHVDTKGKRMFAETVKKIIWEYKIAPDTVGIPASDTVEEIQVFFIELKTRTIPMRVLKTIDTAIPYPIVFVLTYGANTAYCVGYKKTGDHRMYCSDWNVAFPFTFTGTNLETVYRGLVTALIDTHSSENDDFDTIVATDKKRQALEREIHALKNKIRDEKRFNKKVSLHAQLRSMREELEKLHSER